ncbi:glycosyltransferase family 4 protein [Butyrivibrio sp. VCD2006]|uniref:glycosyltransferase family 4 protein n=1 Tax=Butyrivibrio sp. VCD2006 TaxID=1280664 RepID=UPI000408D8B8|nr:glycosyltransferase family 4 protein [Butyrivibrio sp. VCD2006]
MSKKRLLVTGSTFPRWNGDTEPRFILDYAKAMTEYFDVHVLVPMAPGAKENEDMEGVNVHRFHYFPIHKWETLCYPGAIVPRIKEKKIRILLVPFLLFSMKHALKDYSEKVDLVHAHWIIPQGIMQSSIKSIPYIVTGHGGDVTSLNIEPFKSMKRKTLKNAKWITTVSGTLEGYIQKMYPNTKTSIIPMGCDTSAFDEKRRIENYFEQGDKKAILFVGRLAEVKGIPFLIEAMKKVDNAILYIVGKGDMETELQKQARGLGEKIVFLGAKTHKELPEIYASADVFVAPSITANDGGKEGFGLVIIEAMASGVPVVASRSGGIVDIINHEQNGILCEEKNVDEIAAAINKVLSDDVLRAKLIENGKKTADNNSYKNVGKRYNEILSNVC